jgi:hypothetical protein
MHGVFFANATLFLFFGSKIKLKKLPTMKPTEIESRRQPLAEAVDSAGSHIVRQTQPASTLDMRP